jgi:hypothetical protein
VTGTLTGLSTPNATSAHTRRKPPTNVTVAKLSHDGRCIQAYFGSTAEEAGSDLLRRHEKSAHNLDSTRIRKAHARPSNAGASHISRGQDQPPGKPYTPAASPLLDGRNLERATLLQSGLVSCDIVSGTDLQSDQADAFQLSSDAALSHQQLPRLSGPVNLPPLSDNAADDSAQQSQEFHQPGFTSSTMRYGNPGLNAFDLFGGVGGSITVFDDIDLWTYFPPQDLDFHFNISTDQQIPNIETRQRSHQRIDATRLPVSTAVCDDQHSFSRYGSPLPSLRSDQQAGSNRISDKLPVSIKGGPCWKISPDDYRQIQESMASYSSTLPKDFVLPSRHTCSRFLEGCIKGLYEHMPFVHISTFSAVKTSPDLLFAMMAIGAQFRFEIHLGVVLFFAAKALIMHLIKSRNEDSVLEAFSEPPCLQAGFRGTSPRSVGETHTNYEPSRGRAHETARLQTMQAILSLMVMASWGPKQLVGEAFAFQGILTVLVREAGLGPERDDETTAENPTEVLWLRWVRAESLRRTKIFAYCFINLQSIAYNSSPSILTSEVHCQLPTSANEWKAENVRRWDEARRSLPITGVSFSDAVQTLFRSSDEATTSESNQATSSIGNYALIFAVHQCIFFLRQGHVTTQLKQASSSLRSEDVDDLSHVLQNWQSRWDRSPESTIEPECPSGPVPFNSTALLRLAWIRLHADLGPCRSLSSRDPHLIVEAFQNCPRLERHPSLGPSILHAAHALSVPVRLGIKFVAKTQTLSWSVQQSLCNLECAIFLSKWFEAIATTIINDPLTIQEAGLISMIRSLVLETGFFRSEAFESAVGDGDAKDRQRQIQHLETAVAMLWAEIFSGTHVFDLVSTIGTSLNLYAKELEDSHTPIN